MKGDPFETIKNIFEKKTKNRKTRILSQSHSAEKLETGDPLGFLKLQFALNIKQPEEGPFGDKNRKNVAQSRKNSK